MRQPPKGVIGWVRRRALPWASRWSAAAGLAMLAGLVLVRVITDRWLWSQYAFWLPAEGWVAAAWALLAVSALLGWKALRPGGVRLRALLAAGALGASGWLVIGHWRAHRALLPSGVGGPGSVRLVQWNVSAQDLVESVGARVVALGPDVVVLANLRLDGQLGEAERALQAHFRVGEETGGSVVRVHGFLLASRWPIVRSGLAMLSPLDGRDEAWRGNHEPGRVAFVGIDAPGGELIVWAVDLPSDPTLHRRRVMDAAAAAVDRWRAPERRMQGPGEGQSDFPRPDFVAGDFNTPRGSASIRRLVGPLREAHDEAGWGRGTTWRAPESWNGRRLPGWLAWVRPWAGAWAIDLVFAGDDWRVTNWRGVRIEGAVHDAVVVEAVPAGTEAREKGR